MLSVSCDCVAVVGDVPTVVMVVLLVVVDTVLGASVGVGGRSVILDTR